MSRVGAEGLMLVTFRPKELPLAWPPTRHVVTVRLQRPRDLSPKDFAVAASAADRAAREPSIDDGAFVDVTNPVPPTGVVIGVVAIAAFAIVGVFTFALSR
jgi:hypothetical protein